MQEAQSTKKPFYKKWWFIVIAIVFGLAIIGSVLPSDGLVDQAVTQVQPPATEPTVIPELTPEPTPEPEVTLTVGDTASVGSWEITLDSFEFVDRIATSEFFGYTAPEGNQYLYALVTVTNLDSGPRTFMPTFGGNSDFNANVIYDDSFTFTRNRLMTYRDELEGRQTNPLTSTTGGVIFAVADRAVESDSSLILRFFTNRDEVIFILR